MTIPGYEKFLEHLQSEHIASHQRMEEVERRAEEWRRYHPPKPLRSVEEIIGKPKPQYINFSPPLQIKSSLPRISQFKITLPLRTKTYLITLHDPFKLK